MAAAAFAMLFAFAFPGHKAYATITNLGPLTPAVSVPLFGSHFGKGSVFADTFSFTLTADASLTSILGSVQFEDITGIAGFTSSLWQAGGVSPLATGITTTLDGPFGTTITKSFISYALLLAGPPPIYEIRTGGTVFGESGKYGGLVTVSPIPEPEIYAMLLAGLGVMGFVARRRKQQAAAA
jgi:hypothetical protein